MVLKCCAALMIVNVRYYFALLSSTLCHEAIAMSSPFQSHVNHVRSEDRNHYLGCEDQNEY